MSIQNLPVGMIIVIGIAIVAGLLSFIYAHIFFKLIRYKQSLVFYLEFFLNSDEIKMRMTDNPKSRKYYKLSVILVIISLIASISSYFYLSVIPS